MITFDIPDMTCQHCERQLSQAIHAIDPQARLSFALAAHRLQIEPGNADAQALLQAIRQAGYTPTLVASAAPAAVPTPQATPAANAAGATRRQGCCCG